MTMRPTTAIGGRALSSGVKTAMSRSSTNSLEGEERIFSFSIETAVRVDLQLEVLVYRALSAVAAHYSGLEAGSAC